MILRSDIVLSRSGYSTLMDLALFGKKAILVPTPGQTEQEYLASYHNKLEHFYYMSQKDFNLATAIIKSEDFNGFKLFNNYEVLKERIKIILSKY